MSTNVHFEDPNSTTAQERSRSRGRDFKSSGRGGAGNIRSAAAIDEGTYVESVPVRGRETSEPSAGTTVRTGRGGAGNFRSPSRDPGALATKAHDDEIIRANLEANQGTVHSSGRGGAGNMVGARNPSASRSRSRGPAVHLTGRGGAGNIVLAETPYGDDKAHADDGASRGRESAVHSTGRGTPPTESATHAAPQRAESTGRGGAGNILRGVFARSSSRDQQSQSTPRTTMAGASIDGGAPTLARGRERVPYGGASAASAYEGDATDAPERALDFRAETRSRSRDVSQASVRSAGSRSAEQQTPQGFWERVRHPLSPRGSYVGQRIDE